MKTPITRAVLVNTSKGRRLATVTVYLEDIAQNLVYKATQNSKGEARMCWGAIRVKVSDESRPRTPEPLLTDEERAALKDASK